MSSPVGQTFGLPGLLALLGFCASALGLITHQEWWPAMTVAAAISIVAIVPWVSAWPRGLAIGAPRAAVWPWLVQMGYDRGWWYTDARWYQWVEKYLWKGKPHMSPDRIIPDFQRLEVGDTFPDGPPGTAFFTVAALEPQRELALSSTTHLLFLAPASLRNNPRIGLYGEFSWVFLLDEDGEGVTRLIVRTRASYGPRLYRMLTVPLLYPAQFLMERMMLRAIKQRAQRSGGSNQATEQAEAPASG